MELARGFRGGERKRESLCNGRALENRPGRKDLWKKRTGKTSMERFPSTNIGPDFQTAVMNFCQD